MLKWIKLMKFLAAPILGLLFILMLRTPVFAHDLSGDSVTVCEKDGTYTVKVTFYSWKPQGFGGSNADIGVQENTDGSGFGSYVMHGAFTSTSGQFTYTHAGLPGSTTSEVVKGTALVKWDDNVNGGQSKTVTVTLPKPCVPQKGKLRVIKTVVNGYGGNLTASQVELFIGGTQVTNNTFYDVDPGDYHVYENQVAGYTESRGSGSDCNVNGNVSVKAGESKTCKITNTQNPNEEHLTSCKVWDKNENLQFEVGLGDVLLPGWTLTADGTLVKKTGDNGCVTFTLKFGTHTICETLQDGWVSVSPNLCQQVNITEKPPETVYFFNRKKHGDITGFKVNDVNGDGAQNGSEGGLGGVTVTVSISGSLQVITTGVTANNGYVYFKNLPENVYLVCETVPIGWIATSKVCFVVVVKEGTSPVVTFTNSKDVPTALPEIDQPGQGEHHGVYLPAIEGNLN